MRKTAYSSYLKKQHYNVQKQQIKIETWDCRKFKSISKLNEMTKRLKTDCLNISDKSSKDKKYTQPFFDQKCTT